MKFSHLSAATNYYTWQGRSSTA